MKLSALIAFLPALAAASPLALRRVDGVDNDDDPVVQYIYQIYSAEQPGAITDTELVVTSKHFSLHNGDCRTPVPQVSSVTDAPAPAGKLMRFDGGDQFTNIYAIEFKTEEFGHRVAHTAGRFEEVGGDRVGRCTPISLPPQLHPLCAHGDKLMFIVPFRQCVDEPAALRPNKHETVVHHMHQAPQTNTSPFWQQVDI